MTKKQHYMTWEERCQLEALLGEKVPVAKIAKRLGFCRQTIYDANQGLKAREGGRKTAQKSRECKYVANKSHNTLLRCLRQ